MKTNDFNRKYRSGQLDGNYDFESDTLRFAPSDKFLQVDDFRMSNGFIDFLLTAPKYPLNMLTVGNVNNAFNVNARFGDLNSEHNFSTNAYDYCKSGVRFYAVKEGDKRIHLLAMFTYNTPNGISCGMYYLPKGRFDKCCLVARYCLHRGTNDHVNKLDGSVVSSEAFHVHRMSEEFYDYAKSVSKSHDHLVTMLQSPDAAIIPGIECSNIARLVQVAMEQMNVTYNMINIQVEENRRNQMTSQILAGINGYESEMGGV